MVIAENGIMITETSNFQNRSTHCRKSAIVLTVLMASVLTLESLAALAWYFNIPKIWRDEEPTSVDLGDSHYCFDQLQICGSNEVCELLATQVSSNGFPMNSTYRCQACTENSTRVLCPDNIEGLSGYEFCGNPEFDFCVVKKAFTEDSRSVKTMELKTCSSAGSITCPKSTVQCCTTERCRYSYKAGDCYCAQ